MRELITDEMVETAARAAFRDGYMRLAPEHENRELSDYDDGIRESWRVVARAALEAAAPAIAAAALRRAIDAADEAFAREDIAMTQWGNGYIDGQGAALDFISRLRARADQIEMEAE